MTYAQRHDERRRTRALSTAAALLEPQPLRQRRRRPAPPDVAQGDAAWVLALNRVATAVLVAEGHEAWHDLERCWHDLHALFGPASALRLLDLAELATLVEA